MKMDCYIKKYLAEQLISQKFDNYFCNNDSTSISIKLSNYVNKNPILIKNNILSLNSVTDRKRTHIESGYERYEVSQRHFSPCNIYSCHAHFCEMCWRTTQFFSSLQSKLNFDSFDQPEHIRKLVTKFTLDERSQKEFEGKSFRERSTRFCDEHYFRNTGNSYRRDHYYSDSFRLAISRQTPLLLYKLSTLKTTDSLDQIRKSVSYFRKVIYELTRDNDKQWINYLFMSKST